MNEFTLQLKDFSKGNALQLDEVNIVRIDTNTSKATIEGTISNRIITGEVIQSDDEESNNTITISLTSLFAGGELIINLITKEVKLTIFGSGIPIIEIIKGNVVDN